MWRVNSCCCFPLRKGLLVFGYIIIVINYVIILGLMFKINDIYSIKSYFNPASSITTSLSFAFAMVQFAYNMVLVAALRKKSAGLIEHYYHFMTVLLVIQSAGVAFYIPLVVYQNYPLMGFDVVKLFVAMLLIGGVIVALQFYVVVLVYSVMSELREEREKELEVDIVVEPGPSIPLTEQTKQLEQC